MFILIGSILVQVLYTLLRNAINAVGNFDIIDLGASLGTQMFVFVWISCATSGLAVILAAGACCFGRARGRIPRKGVY